MLLQLLQPVQLSINFCLVTFWRFAKKKAEDSRSPDLWDGPDIDLGTALISPILLLPLRLRRRPSLRQSLFQKDEPEPRRSG